VCTIAEANDLMSKGAVELFAPTPAVPDKPPGRQVSVTTDPPGAAIELDGTKVDGQTPMQLTVPPGEHTIRATLDGHVSTELKVAPDATDAKLTLPALGKPYLPPPPGETRWGAWKWVGAGVSVAALAVGIGLVAMNNSCADSLCKDLHSTAAGGGVLIAVGAVAGAATIYFFATDHPRRVEAAVIPTRGGAAAWLGVRF
jgi:hypothetical protein